MDAEWRVAVLVALAVLSTAGWLLLRRRDGVAQAVDRGERVTADEIGAELGGSATLLQFSSETCTTCRAARRVLGRIAAAEAGVAHVELDAGDRLDLARRHHVLRTPTVLVLDRDGLVVRRFSGAPTPAQARDAVAGILPAPTS